MALEVLTTNLDQEPNDELQGTNMNEETGLNSIKSEKQAGKVHGRDLAFDKQ